FSWHEGPALKETCLAFVWGDGKLKRWRLQDEKERPWPGEAGKYVYFTTRLMHASSTSASCLTGSIDGDGCGQIKVWDLPARQAPEVRSGEEFVWKCIPGSQGSTFLAPWTLATFSAQGDGRLDRLAVIVRSARKGEASNFHLQILDLRRDTFLKRQGHVVELGKSSGSDPVLATSPQGKFLAVAGTEDQTIRVLPIKNLLLPGGLAPPVQKLDSVGSLFRFVVFVRK